MRVVAGHAICLLNVKLKVRLLNLLVLHIVTFLTNPIRAFYELGPVFRRMGIMALLAFPSLKRCVNDFGLLEGFFLRMA